MSVRIAIGAAAAVVAAAFALVAVREMHSDDGRDARGSVRVPLVEGLKNPQAEAALVRVGLRWRFVGSPRVRSEPTHGPNVAVEPFDSDEVVEQQPFVGTMVPRSTVIVLETRCSRAAREGDGLCA